jgi:hypothetical protein
LSSGAAGPSVSKLPTAPWRHFASRPVNLFNATPGLRPLKAPETPIQGITSHYNETQKNTAHPIIFSMQRKSAIIRGPSLRRVKKAKLVELVPQENYRGTRYVPVEVSDMASPPKPRKRASRQPRAERNDTLQHETPQHETPPQPMDIDETFWTEEPVMPTSEKKVRRPASSSSMNLTYPPVRLGAHLPGGIYPQDWPLLTLPPQF